MNLRALCLLPLLGLAAAQTTVTQTTATQTTSPQTPPDQTSETPATPEPVAPLQPTIPTDLSATLTAPRSVKGKVPLTLTVKSSRTAAFDLEVARDNEQNCVTAPTVRVLRVGTREVVYPKPNQQPSLCAQDMRTDHVAAGGKVNYVRDLDLPAGEYMIEGWLKGFAGGERVKIPAQPVRVTVK